MHIATSVAHAVGTVDSPIRSTQTYTYVTYNMTCDRCLLYIYLLFHVVNVRQICARVLHMDCFHFPSAFSTIQVHFRCASEKIKKNFP